MIAMFVDGPLAGSVVETGHATPAPRYQIHLAAAWRERQYIPGRNVIYELVLPSATRALYALDVDAGREFAIAMVVKGAFFGREPINTASGGFLSVYPEGVVEGPHG